MSVCLSVALKETAAARMTRSSATFVGGMDRFLIMTGLKQQANSVERSCHCQNWQQEKRHGKKPRFGSSPD
jgi:hypothetical protein